MVKGQKRAHFLQHVPFEGLGSIEVWLKQADYAISHTKFYETSTLPETEEIDMLIIMGGPMSVNDQDRFPWLSAEKKFIKNVVRSGKAVLGVCLGAQLIASAMGAEVYPNREKEIGWYPVNGVHPEEVSVFQFPDNIDVFHWHGETFTLPSGATLLARSQGCEHQAFQLGRSVIGLQFHLETTAETAKAIVANCGDELVESKYVQSADQILSAQPECYHAINKLMGDVLTFLASGAR